MKRSIAWILAVLLLVSVCVLPGCGNDGSASSGDAVQVSYWISKGEDSKYYMSYEENPAVKYLETLEFNGKKIDLSFVVPISGAELDNFNTLLMTDEYTGIMDMSFSTSTALELYEDGYVYDLTPYMEEYMPNYLRVVEENPHLESLVFTNVDGEKKVLSLYSITDELMGNFMGYLYRRDWVAKYGKHPETDAAFTYGYTDPADFNTWYDDVVFPSGGADPVYISDWEWMFEIFEVAMADLGITDGYCLAPYFKGFQEDGGFYSGFGGGNPMWSRTADGNAIFGGDSDNMRAMLQCLNTWWEKGWLDKNFVEHTGDQVYTTDSTKVHTGKVGMWIGRRAETGGQMDLDDPLTDGIYVAGARQPINDIYGGEAQKNKEPDSMFQQSQLRGGLVITNKIAEEDLPTVLTFLDYLYTAEGGTLMCFGLNDEQFEQMQDEAYIKFGLTDGAVRTEEQPDGTVKYIRTESLIADNDLASAMAAKRMTVGWYAPGFVPALNASYMPCATDAMAEWDYYLNTGYPDKAFRTLFTAEESTTYDKVHANVDTFMSTQLPKFIMGNLDIDNDQDWTDYCKMLNKYSPDKVTKVYQRIFELTK